MADFEKVYSVNYDVSKALENLRRLEKILVSIDTKSKELFQSQSTKFFREQTVSAQKMEIEKSKFAQRAEKERVRQAERAERLKLRARERAESKGERLERDRVRSSTRAEKERVRQAERAERLRIRAQERAEVKNERLERQRARNAERAERRRVRAAEKTETRRSALRRTGGALVGAGAVVGVAAGVREVTSEFVDFDQAITSAAAKFSRLEPAIRPGTEGFKEFAKEIREAGLGTEHSAAAVAQAMDFWAKAGKTADQSKAVLRATLDFASSNQDAAGSMLDVARAGDILSDTLGAFKLEAETSEQLMASTARASDVMSAAANRANMSAEELFEAFTNAGPALTSVGSDIEETSALLAAMANAGIKGSAAGNQLKMVISNLAALTGPQTAALNKLGVSVKDSEGNFKGLTTVIRELNVATADMGSGDRYEVFAKAAGRRAVPAFINLLAEGKTNLDEMAASLRKAGGETQNLADQMRTSAQAKMSMFWNRLRDIGFRLIDATDLFGGLTRAMNAPNWDALIAGGQRVSAAFSGFLDAAPGMIIQAFDRLEIEFAQFFRHFERILDNMTRLFGGMATGVESEWGDTLRHLIALGDTLLEQYSGVFEEMKALVFEVVTAFTGGADDIENRWEITGNQLGVQISEAVQFISAVIGTIAQVAGAVFSTVLRVTTVVVQNIKSIFGDLFGGILDIAQGDFLDGIARVGLALADAITMPFRTAITGLLKLVSKIPGAESLADSIGVDLDYMSDIVAGGFGATQAPEAKEISQAGDIQRTSERVEIAPFTPQSFAVPDPIAPQSFAPDSFESPVSSNIVDNIQAALAGAGGTEAINKLVEISTESAVRQEARAAETRVFEQHMTSAAGAGQKQTTNNIEVGPTTVKIEAKGASFDDVKRAVDQGTREIRREVQRGVQDGLGSIGPSEI